MNYVEKVDFTAHLKSTKFAVFECVWKIPFVNRQTLIRSSPEIWKQSCTFEERLLQNTVIKR